MCYNVRTMTTNNTETPTALISVSDVTLASLVNEELTGTNMKQVLEDDAVYGILNEWGYYGKEDTPVGWYRVTKREKAFVFESFLGDDRDPSQPLWSTVLPLGERSVQMDSYYSLLAAVLGEKEVEPEFPSPELIVFRWVSDQNNASRLRYQYAPLFERIEGLHLFSAGGACPFQAEGTIAGLFFYFRFRGEHMSLTLASEYEDIWSKPLYASSQAFGDGSGFTGWLDGGDFVEQFTFMVQKLERSPMLWRFEGVFTEDHYRDKAGDPSEMSTWGHTPEEAWDRLMQIGSDSGDIEAAQAYIAKYALDPQTVTVDDRVFPDPEPDFRALVSDLKGKSE